MFGKLKRLNSIKTILIASLSYCTSSLASEVDDLKKMIATQQAAQLELQEAFRAQKELNANQQQQLQGLQNQITEVNTKLAAVEQLAASNSKLARSNEESINLHSRGAGAGARIFTVKGRETKCNDACNTFKASCIGAWVGGTGESGEFVPVNASCDQHHGHSGCICWEPTHAFDRN